MKYGKRKKRLLKHVIRRIFGIYEEVRSTSSREDGRQSFVNGMLLLYMELFKGSSHENPFPKYENNPYSKSGCCYKFYYYSNTDVARSHLELSASEYSSIIKMLDGLKEQVYLGNMFPIKILRTETSIVHNGSLPHTTTTKYTAAGVSAKSDDDKATQYKSGFVWDFGSEQYNIKHNRCKTCRDFWDYDWCSLVDFVWSAFVTYLVHWKTFEKIKICKFCGKINLPSRGGHGRGVFCCAICQKKYYNHSNKVVSTCIAKQRQYINVRLDFVSNKPVSKDGFIGIDVNKIVPSIDKCRKCDAINNGSVRSGECLYLINNKSVECLKRAYKNAKAITARAL